LAANGRIAGILLGCTQLPSPGRVCMALLTRGDAFEAPGKLIPQL
jgi:hypothetical protein